MENNAVLSIINNYNMKTTSQITYLTNKLNFLLDSFNTCDKSMKDYYYNEIKKYQLLIADLK